MAELELGLNLLGPLLTRLSPGSGTNQAVPGLPLGRRKKIVSENGRDRS